MAVNSGRTKLTIATTTSTPSKTFSTRFNFASHLGVGVRLGAQQQHEWLLRVQHVSNAGLKKPNPGENFLQLRYALHF